jgi:hypothetical protein
MIVPDINEILVEKYGTKIIYRSRNCDRLFENKGMKILYNIISRNKEASQR